MMPEHYSGVKGPLAKGMPPDWPRKGGAKLRARCAVRGGNWQRGKYIGHRGDDGIAVVLAGGRQDRLSLRACGLPTA